MDSYRPMGTYPEEGQGSTGQWTDNFFLKLARMMLISLTLATCEVEYARLWKGFTRLSERASATPWQRRRKKKKNPIQTFLRMKDLPIPSRIVCCCWSFRDCCCCLLVNVLYCWPICRWTVCSVWLCERIWRSLSCIDRRCWDSCCWLDSTLHT